MRLVHVAKALGMTGQELRHELLQVNFGVKSTDREVTDALARGIIRFLAAKKGITVNMDALGLEPTAAEEASESAGGPAATAPAPLSPDTATSPAGDSLHVLRKLSLDDVPRSAVARQAQQTPRLSKAEQEERKFEEKRMQPQKKRGVDQTNQEQIKKKEGMVLLPDSISVKELAEKTGVQVPLLIQTLLKNGVMATVTQSIDFETAAIVASELGVQVQREERSAKAEDLLSRNLEELLKDDPENLEPRPPVVVVMGHVDHGKTALLDAIRETNVVSEEAGGITQHIGAYQVEHRVSGREQPRRITFLDTPGHEAFTAMRARGAQVTDIVILVVSAEEGVKATTVEAIDHAREAEVPIIVAITKIDKERANVERVKGEIAAHGLQPEEWGGEVPVVLCSAVTKQGIPGLLDHILLLADLKKLAANPRRLAVATVIESHLDSALGPIASVVVNAGTLTVGDICVCGNTMGKVKALMDEHEQRLSEALPSGVVRVSGFDDVPAVGDILQVVPSEREARVLLEALRERSAFAHRRQFSDLVTRLSEGKVKHLKIVLKADAQGSLEAIQEALRLQGAATEGALVKVIHAAVGAVSESDVMMASASDGLILAFHAPVSADVLRTAEREGVQVRPYTIVYQLLDEVDALRKGLLEPEEKEEVVGHLEVRGVFLTKKTEQIIGGRVRDGVIKRLPFRLQRGEKIVGTGRIVTLRHVDKDIREAKEGSECGMRVETSIPILEGDVLEVFLREFKRVS